MSASVKIENLNWPLMENNVTMEDRNVLMDFLRQEDRLTQSRNVEAFEKEWSEWLGVKYSVFVNSGSSANLITLSVLKEVYGLGEIVVPALTWVSDIASVLQCGFQPVFADIDPASLGMDAGQTIGKISSKTKAVFLTHILGLNGLRPELMEALRRKDIALIEDACESHGAVFQGKKVGSFGLISNFSFYYAHHMSTVEGGMISTNDESLHQKIRMFRSHGLVRESTSEELRARFAADYPDLDQQFIFAYPAYNMRSTEMNAVIGRRQLKRLDQNIERRNENYRIFLENLDSQKYKTDFSTEGCSNYALTLVLQPSATHLCDEVMAVLRQAHVEFRRGLSGGGNQLRQPYLRKLFPEAYKNFPQTEHVHFYGFYVGNHPDLPKEKIKKLCGMLNAVSGRGKS